MLQGQNNCVIACRRRAKTNNRQSDCFSVIMQFIAFFCMLPFSFKKVMNFKKSYLGFLANRHKKAWETLPCKFLRCNNLPDKLILTLLPIYKAALLIRMRVRIHAYNYFIHFQFRVGYFILKVGVRQSNVTWTYLHYLLV